MQFVHVKAVQIREQISLITRSTTEQVYALYRTHDGSLAVLAADKIKTLIPPASQIIDEISALKNEWLGLVMRSSSDGLVGELVAIDDDQISDIGYIQHPVSVGKKVQVIAKVGKPMSLKLPYDLSQHVYVDGQAVSRADFTSQYLMTDADRTIFLSPVNSIGRNTYDAIRKGGPFGSEFAAYVTMIRHLTQVGTIQDFLDDTILLRHAHMGIEYDDIPEVFIPLTAEMWDAISDDCEGYLTLPNGMKYSDFKYANDDESKALGLIPQASLTAAEDAFAMISSCKVGNVKFAAPAHIGVHNYDSLVNEVAQKGVPVSLSLEARLILKAADISMAFNLYQIEDMMYLIADGYTGRGLYMFPTDEYANKLLVPASRFGFR